jgi:predicted nucleic acid-binding protein
VILVDTGAWFASVVPSDPDYATASDWLRKNTEPLMTTDYIVDETLTLLRARGEELRALRMGEEFFNGTLATIYHLTEADIRLAWETFRSYSDKKWSFTDCASKVVIDKLNLKYAFAFDHHFRQFGTVNVLP